MTDGELLGLVMIMLQESAESLAVLWLELLELALALDRRLGLDDVAARLLGSLTPIWKMVWLDAPLLPLMLLWPRQWFPLMAVRVPLDNCNGSHPTSALGLPTTAASTLVLRLMHVRFYRASS